MTNRPTLRLDFESRSTVDLRTAGVHVYASHPTSDVWCCCFAVDDAPVESWRIGEPCPRVIRRAAEEGWIIRAWNAAFEERIWNGLMAVRHDWPPIRLENVRCTMAEALALALPGKLETACEAVSSPIKKDMAGAALMKRMMRPRKVHPDGQIVWWDDPERLDRLVDYCVTDVEAERAIGKRILPLSEAEQALWVLDQRINARGVLIDMPVVRTALEVIAATKDELDRRMSEATEGAITHCSKVKELTAWVVTELDDDVAGLAKADILDLLERPDLPGHVRRALLIRQEAAKASTAKLKAMRLGADVDGRARGLHQYHGANTGRWAGRRIQTQNLPRTPEGWTPEMTDEVCTMMEQG